jgi:hypothetical protein
MLTADASESSKFVDAGRNPVTVGECL